MALENFRQGDTYQFDIQYNSELEDGTTSYIDITDFIFTLTLKQNFDDPDDLAALQFSHTAGQGELDQPTKGYCVISVPASLTNIPTGNYFYDLQVIEKSGTVVTIDPPISEYRQKLTVIPQVTQRIV